MTWLRGPKVHKGLELFRLVRYREPACNIPSHLLPAASNSSPAPAWTAVAATAGDAAVIVKGRGGKGERGLLSPAKKGARNGDDWYVGGDTGGMWYSVRRELHEGEERTDSNLPRQLQPSFR